MRDLVRWPARRWWVATAGAIVVALAIALPTALLPNPMFTRMTPPTWSQWTIWAATSVLAGLVLVTHVRTPTGAAAGICAGGGGILSLLAVGCPLCNKVVVSVLGNAGAMQWWAPVQPLLGVGAVVLLARALWIRIRAADGGPTNTVHTATGTVNTPVSPAPEVATVPPCAHATRISFDSSDAGGPLGVR